MKYLYTLLFLLPLLFSCSVEETPENGLILSRLSYTFSYDGRDSVVVAVECNSEWDCTSSSEQFEVKKISRDSFMVKALPNEKNEEISSEVRVESEDKSCTFKVNQMAKCFSGQLSDYYPTSQGAMSANGYYAAYVAEYPGGDFRARLVNLSTFEETVLEIPEVEDLLTISGITAVSDDGRCVIFMDGLNARSFYSINGEIVDLPLPEGCRLAKPQDMSADGSVIVGYCHDKDNLYLPIKWTSFGESYEILERPTDNAAGTGLVNGTIARGCSADGSVIYGSEWRYFGLVYWKDGKLYNPGIDYAKITPGTNGNQNISRIVKFSDNRSVSNNGKYIVSYYMDMESGYEIQYPVLINTVTGNVDIMRELQYTAAFSVNDDGVVFGVTPAMGMSTGYCLDFETRTAIPISEWFMDNYGIILSDDNRFVSDNPRKGVFFGQRMYSGGLSPFYPNWHLVIE